MMVVAIGVREHLLLPSTNEENTIVRCPRAEGNAHELGSINLPEFLHRRDPKERHDSREI